MIIRIKTKVLSFVSAAILPIAAFAAGEGTPVYYQNGNSGYQKNTSAGYQNNRAYSNYIGQSGQKQVIGSNNYSYQVPRNTYQANNGSMTTNGIALPASSEPDWLLSASYGRRFADFQFKTGVNSILEWDDMRFNEITLNGKHNFSVKNFDLFAYGEYSVGNLATGGLSMDYDLEPYDSANPHVGIFTISMGDMSAKTKNLSIGFGAHHIWDVAGWKLSPSIGYEIFQHDLQMSNHIYPNPGIYLPLMTSGGDYVFGDEAGNYYTLPTTSAIPDGWYQVCLSPEDIKVVDVAASTTYISLGTAITTVDYDPATMDTLPWGVGSGECVIIGGDGVVKVEGTTHIYNTTWSGAFIGLELEKQMTLSDKLRFYVQFGMPNYSSEGIWPNRTDWQQSPSFIDEGNNGAYSYKAEMEYNYKLSDRVQLALKVDMNYFYVGNIPGQLYVAEYSYYQMDTAGQYVLDTNGLPILQTVAAHTEEITDSLKSAVWQSFGLHLTAKYSF